MSEEMYDTKLQDKPVPGSEQPIAEPKAESKE